MNQAHAREPLPLEGRWVALEPLRSSHIPALREMVGRAAMLGRWPRTDIDMAEAAFERELWRLASLNHAVIRRRTGDVVGLTQGINEHLENRTVGLSIMFDSRLWRRGWTLEALVLTINLFFQVYGFRKVYCQMAESTRSSVDSAIGRWLTHEATFRRHERRGDDYEDWHIYALYEQEWGREIAAYVEAGLRQAQSR